MQSKQYKKSKRPNKSKKNSPITCSIIPKFEDYLQDAGAITTTGHITTLTVGQAVGNNRRIANRMRIYKIEYHYFIAASATDGNNIIRVLYGQTRGDAFTLTQCPPINEPLDPFKAVTLRDHIVPLYSFENTNDGPGVVKRVIKGTINMNCTVYFDGANYDDYRSPFPFIYMISDSGVTPYPTVDGWTRVYFSD